MAAETPETNGVNPSIGNVGTIREVKHGADNNAIANLSLATSEQWKDKSGARQEENR